MNFTTKMFPGLAVLLITMPGSTLAHHSFAAHYDPSQTVQVSGIVKDFQLRSPHTFLHLEVEQENGAVEVWEVEAASMPHMRRSGFDENTFRAGDEVIAMGFPSRIPDKPAIFGSRFVTRDGTEMGAMPAGARGPAPTTTAVGINRLEGRWMSPRPGGGGPRSPGSALPLTPAGQTAWESFVEALSPLANCQPAQVPALFYAPAYLHDIDINDGQVVFYHEVFDVTRTVPLDSEPLPAEPTGFYGLVSGRIEGDELVVESSGYPESAMGLAFASSAIGNGADVPSSVEKTVVERYSVSDDGGTLRIEYTVTDPVYMTEPYSNSLQYTRVPEDTPAYGLHCEE